MTTPVQDPLGTIHAIATNDDFCDPAIDFDDPSSVDAQAFNPEDTEETVTVSYAEKILKTYRASRELKDLPIKKEAKPTIFKLKQLKTKFTVAVDGMSFENQLCLSFVAACFEIVPPDGAPLKPKKPLKPVVIGGHNLPDEDDWIETVRKKYGIATILEMGAVAYQKARLPEDAKSGFLSVVGLPRVLSKR